MLSAVGHTETRKGKEGLSHGHTGIRPPYSLIRKGYSLGLVRTEQRALREIPLTGNITLHGKQKRMDNKYSSKFDHELGST